MQPLFVNQCRFLFWFDNSATISLFPLLSKCKALDSKILPPITEFNHISTKRLLIHTDIISLSEIHSFVNIFAKHILLLTLHLRTCHLTQKLHDDCDLASICSCLGFLSGSEALCCCIITTPQDAESKHLNKNLISNNHTRPFSLSYTHSFNNDFKNA